MNAPDLLSALRVRYPAVEYALFTELRNGPGHRRVTRSADAVAMSLWPSRGLDMHGFEVKVSRNDLVRELKDPAKADEIAGYCDFWWLIIPNLDVLPKGKPLPRTWGVLVPDKKGKLVAHTEAQKLKAKPLSRDIFASIFRNAQAAMDRRLEGWVRPEIVDERVRELVDLELMPLKNENERLLRVLKEAQEEMAARRAEAQLFGLQSWSSPSERERVASVVRLLMVRRQDEVVRRLRREVVDLEEVVASLRRASAALEELPPIEKT